MRQFLTESLLLAGAGALAGLGIAYGSLRLASALMPEANIVLRSQTFGLTRIGLGLITIDWTTMLFTVAVAGLTAMLFGLLPAWHASRSEIVNTMKAGAGSIAPGTGGRNIRNLLIAGETALALVLLVASGLMLQSVNNLQRTELGFEPDGLVTVVAVASGRAVRRRSLDAVLERSPAARARAAGRAVGGVRQLSADLGRLQRHEREFPGPAAAAARHVSSRPASIGPRRSSSTRWAFASCGDGRSPIAIARDSRR